MQYAVVFSPESLEHLLGLYQHIAVGSPRNAENYTTAIVDYCLTLAAFPHRASAREDIRPGMRITNYKGRAIIAFAVDERLLQVYVIGVYYGGQDYESILQDE